MRAIRMLYWEIKMDFLRTFRYRFGMITDFIVYFVLFMILMVTDAGTSYIDTYGYENYKSMLLIGYISWMYAISAISDVSGAMGMELGQGTLYKKLSSKFSLQFLYWGVFISGVLLETITIVLVVLISKIFWNIDFTFHPYYIIPLFIGTVGMYGIGLIVAGLRIYYKKIGSVIFLIQTALLFITDTVPTDTSILNITKMIPLTRSNEVLKCMMTGQHWIGKMVTLVLFSIIWLLVGSKLFMMLLNRAKKKGNLLFY